MNILEYQKLYQEFTSRVAASAQHLESVVIESEKDLIMPLAEKAKKIYDLGTGNGRIPKFLSEQGIEASIYGIESNWQMFVHANEFQTPTIRFFYSDLLNWLKSADEADLILCMGNAIGGLLDEKYRNSVFASVFEKLQKGGYFVMDYRPIDAVLKNDFVMSKESQNYGELIVTIEDVSGEKMRLAQFYPNEELLIQFMISGGFGVSNQRLLEGTKYVRKAIILEKENVS